MGPGAYGLEPTAGHRSEDPVTQTSLEVESVFGSTADEYAVSGAGSIHPPLNDVICPGFRSEATVGEGVLDKGVSGQPDYIHRPDYRSVKIQDSRLRLVSGWDSPLHGRQAWRSGC